MKKTTEAKTHSARSRQTAAVCRLCKQKIPKGARKCHHCGSYQSRWNWLSYAPLLVSFVMVGVAVVQAVLGYTQLNEAKRERILASQALARAKAAEETARSAAVQANADANAIAHLRDRVESQHEQFSQLLADLKKEQEKFATIILLHDLAIKAESGDLKAFIRLGEVAKLQEPELSHAAVRFIRRVYDMHFGQTPFRYPRFDDSVPDSQVIERLDDENFIIRRRAVYTVRKRKMYDQVPSLIQRINLEQNLDVLASIQATLNYLLDVKYELLQDDAQSKYQELWEQKNSSLLKTEK